MFSEKPLTFTPCIVQKQNTDRRTYAKHETINTRQYRVALYKNYNFNEIYLL